MIDVFTADRRYGAASREAVGDALAEGALVACEVVWAELAAAFDQPSEAIAAMRTLGVRYSALDEHAALVAGESWRRYRAAGGRRNRVVADFLIAAHATSLADRLLTRDRGFYRRYFRDLCILEPAQVK